VAAKLLKEIGGMMIETARVEPTPPPQMPGWGKPY
jgi:hypothetical protein